MSEATTTIRLPVDNQATEDQCRRCELKGDWECLYGCLGILGYPLCITERRE
ncbi:hypothetical protein LCGC14_0992980 [marine sediment metagenome]|uniref:Uncharacterized protein n=1 Tax=marine sediment metagenome TaxID=412755 RepID=A0A0F9N588_9ZZZZ